MKIKEFDLLLDIKSKTTTTDFEVVQNDRESNVIHISLVEDLETYDITNLKIEIAFRKSDGKTVLQDEANGILIENNKIKCILKTNTIACPGKVIGEVRVIKDNKILTSTTFGFFVRKAIVNDETIKSTDEFPILDQKIKEVDELSIKIEGMKPIRGDTGERGPIGKTGESGKSSYEIWLSKGNKGTEEEYLKSLKGDKGDRGERGPQGFRGLVGENGKSSYEIWLSKDNEGTEEEYLKSLEGDKGSDANVTSENIIKALEYVPGDELNIKKNTSNIGKLEELKTDNKNNTVSAINEIFEKLENKVDREPIYKFRIENGNSSPSAVYYEGSNTIDKIPMKMMNDYDANRGDWREFIEKLCQPVMLKEGKINYILKEDIRKKINNENSNILGDDGDVMIRFRSIYKKITVNDKKDLIIEISLDPFIGAECINSDIEKGYSIFNFGHLDMLQTLSIMLFKSRDIQSSLGNGLVNELGAGVTIKTGSILTKGMNFGDKDGFKLSTKFLGIEGLWDSGGCFVDGYIFNPKTKKYGATVNNFDKLDKYKTSIIASSAFVTNGHIYPRTMNAIYPEYDDIFYTNWMALEDGGSTSTYYPDVVTITKREYEKIGYATLPSPKSIELDSGIFSIGFDYGVDEKSPYTHGRLTFKDEKYTYIGVFKGSVIDGKLRSIYNADVKTGITIEEARALAYANN